MDMGNGPKLNNPITKISKTNTLPQTGT